MKLKGKMSIMHIEQYQSAVVFIIWYSFSVRVVHRKCDQRLHTEQDRHISLFLTMWGQNIQVHLCVAKFIERISEKENYILNYENNV